MRSFAFLIPDDKTQPDIYLHANDLKSAMNGDIVLVRVTAQSQGGGRMEGEVVRVVTRAVTQVSVPLRAMKRMALYCRMINGLTGIFS